MRVLFVCRGNKKFNISPIIRAQADSLKESGCTVDIYPIEGKGLISYVKSLQYIYRISRNGNYNIVHAHFGFSALACTMVIKPRRLVVSLMGSELYRSAFYRLLYTFLARYIWKRVIVKTRAMANIIGTRYCTIIPNGVNLELFTPVDKLIARSELGLDSNDSILLFPSYAFRKEKNYSLAQSVAESLGNVRLIYFSGYTAERVNLLYNAADAILLPSSFEGSPNVIKEAMACNRPVVATDVGDVKWVVGDVQGTFIAGLDKGELVAAVRNALRFSLETGTTAGRDRIIDLGLDSQSIAERLITLYREAAG